MATGWDSLNANAYATGTDALGAGGWGKAPGTHHVEPRAFLKLYNKAHSESAAGSGRNGELATGQFQKWSILNRLRPRGGMRP